MTKKIPTIKRRKGWPKWAKWAAKDDDGDVYIYDHDPQSGQFGIYGMWVYGRCTKQSYQVGVKIPGPWRSSLRRIV